LLRETPKLLVIHTSYLPQVYAWIGFAVAVVWIYSIAHEIVNLLQVSILTTHPLHLVFKFTMLSLPCTIVEWQLHSG